MRIKILGKYYEFRKVPNLHDNLGMCSDPDGKHKEIIIQGGLPEKEECTVIIHECTHRLWHLDESVVDQFSKDLTHVLYRLGWRKTKDK